MLNLFYLVLLEVLRRQHHYCAYLNKPQQMLIKQKHFFLFLNQDKDKIFLKQEKVSVNEVRKYTVFPLNFVFHFSENKIEYVKLLYKNISSFKYLKIFVLENKKTRKDFCSATTKFA